MVLTDYLGALRRGWPILLGGLLLGVLLSSIATLRAPLEFNSDSSILISAVGSGSPQDRQAGDSFASARAVTYAALATTQEVLQPAAAELPGLSWQELRSRITAVVEDGTSVIQLRAVDTTSASAAAEADAVTTELVQRIESIEAAPTTTDAAGGGRFGARIVEHPQPAAVALFPQPRNNLLAGLVGGLVAGIIVALVRGSLVSVVSRPEVLPRRSQVFDLSSGRRKERPPVRRARRADLLVNVLDRRFGPSWSVVLVAASVESDALRAADALVAAGSNAGSMLSIRMARQDDKGTRGTAVDGATPGSDRLQLSNDEAVRVLDDWEKHTAGYQRVLLVVGPGLPSSVLARAIKSTDLVVVVTVKNSTRILDLRNTTKDLESLGADQVLTVIDAR